jgi:hypothetical protein
MVLVHTVHSISFTLTDNAFILRRRLPFWIPLSHEERLDEKNGGRGETAIHFCE